MLMFSAVIVGIYGLLLGSYFNVVIARVPQGVSVVRPPSACPRCNTRIKWYHNIPVLSYLFLKGKCAYCAAPISIKYPLIELLTGLLALTSFLGAYWYLGIASLVPALSFAWLVICCVPIFIVDIKHYLIPDGVVFPGMALGFVLSFFSPLITVAHSALGLIVPATLLYLFGRMISFFKKRDALGFGDVKLLAMIGAFTGAEGAAATIIIASVIGLLGTLIVKAITKESYEIPLPFGPYILSAALPVFLWKHQIIDAYFSVITPLFL